MQESQKLAQLQGHEKGLNSVQFSPNGACIVTTSSDGTSRVWDSESGEELARLEGGKGTFSPEGLRIATACRDETVRVWNASDGKELARLEGHTSWVNSVAFSPDGTRIVTASADRTARVWEATAGRELARLERNTGRVNFAAFSRDGTRIVTASDDWTAIVWDSIAYRLRDAERRAFKEVWPAGDQSMRHALSRSSGFVEAGELIRDDPALEPLARRAALDLLLERCSAAGAKYKAIEPQRMERLWLGRMLGRAPWPKESQAEAELAADPTFVNDPGALNDSAWALVAPDTPPGDPVRALLLARRAVASADEGSVAMCRDTLARALFRLGRFDGALVEQGRALDEAPDEKKGDYQEYLHRLEADIAAWRDESGNLRRAEWTAKLEALTRKIEELESDPDVRLWLGRGR